MQTQHRPIDTSQFSETDWKRLTDYIALLITIDQRNKKKEKVTQ
jgi:hypothetical protein